MIELTDISIGYDHRQLLTDVSTIFNNGSLYALIGRNGTGKSTLLRAIAGINPHYRGTIIIDGKSISDSDRMTMARHLAFVNTERVRVSNMKCYDIVALGRMPYTNWIGNLTDCDRHIIEKALSLVGMQDYARRSMDTMSDGECQRIMIARAIAQDTPNILLDEPTSFLDIPNRYDLAQLLKTLAHEHDKCIIFSTHELDVALNTCDNIVLIDSPTLINLPPEDITDQGHIKRLFNIP